MQLPKPDEAIRASTPLGWLSAEDAEGALAAKRDRELAFRYQPEIHKEIASRLPLHAAVLRRWLDAIKGIAAR